MGERERDREWGREMLRERKRERAWGRENGENDHERGEGGRAEYLHTILLCLTSLPYNLTVVNNCLFRYFPLISVIMAAT